jgi:integrase
MAMLKVLERMAGDCASRDEPRYVDPKQNDADVVPHGFRATFKTWASERTNFPSELVEAALAHIKGDETEAAYQRGDLLEKRRRLMDAWANFCTKTSEP